MTALARVLMLVAAIITSTGASGGSNPLRYTATSGRDYADDYWRNCVQCGNIYAQDVASNSVEENCDKARLQRKTRELAKAGADQMDLLDLFGESEFGLQENTLAAAPQLRYNNVADHFNGVASAALVLHYPFVQQKSHLTYIDQEFLSLKVQPSAATAPLDYDALWTALQERNRELSWDIADAASATAQVEVPNTASRSLCNAIHTCLARKVQFYEQYGIATSNTALLMAYRDTKYADAHEASFFLLKEKGMATVDSLAKLRAAITADKAMLTELRSEDLKRFKLQIEESLSAITSPIADDSESLQSIFVGFVIERLLSTAAEAQKAYHAAKANVLFQAISMLLTEPSYFVREHIPYTKDTYDEIIPDWTETFRKYMNGLVRHVGLYVTHVQDCLLQRNTFLVAVARIEHVLLAYRKAAQAVWPAFAATINVHAADSPTAAAHCFSMPDISVTSGNRWPKFTDSRNHSPNIQLVSVLGRTQSFNGAPFIPAVDPGRHPNQPGQSMVAQHVLATHAQRFYLYQQPPIPEYYAVLPAQHYNHCTVPYAITPTGCHDDVQPRATTGHHQPAFTTSPSSTHVLHPAPYSAPNLRQYTQGHRLVCPLTPSHPVHAFPPTSIAHSQAQFYPVPHTEHGSAWPSNEQFVMSTAKQSTSHVKHALIQYSMCPTGPSAVSCLSDNRSSQPADVCAANVSFQETINDLRKDNSPTAVQTNSMQSPTVNVSSTPIEAMTTLPDHELQMLGRNTTHVDPDAPCILADGTIYVPEVLQVKPMAAPVLVHNSKPAPTFSTAVVSPIEADIQYQQVYINTAVPTQLGSNPIVSPACQQPQGRSASGQNQYHNAIPEENKLTTTAISIIRKACIVEQDINGCASINGQPSSILHIKSKTGAVQQATSVIDRVELHLGSAPIVDESKSISTDSSIEQSGQPDLDLIQKEQDQELDWKTKEDAESLKNLTLLGNKSTDKKIVISSVAESNIYTTRMANQVSSDISECERNTIVQQRISKPFSVEARHKNCSCGNDIVSGVNASLIGKGVLRANANSLTKSADRLQDLFPHLIFANCSNVQFDKNSPEDIGADSRNVVAIPREMHINGQIVEATQSGASSDNIACQKDLAGESLNGSKNDAAAVEDAQSLDVSMTTFEDPCNSTSPNVLADKIVHTFNSTEPVTETAGPVLDASRQPAKKKKSKHKSKQHEHLVQVKNTGAKLSPNIAPSLVTPDPPKAAKGNFKNGNQSKLGNVTTSYRLVSEPLPNAKSKSSNVLQQPGATPQTSSKKNACSQAKAMTSTTRSNDLVIQDILAATEQSGAKLTAQSDGPSNLTTSRSSNVFNILKSVTANIATTTASKISDGGKNNSSNLLPIPKRLLLSEANREIRLQTLGLPDAGDLDNIFSMKALTDKRPFTIAEKNNLWIKLSNVVQLWKSEEATSERQTVACFGKLTQAIESVVALKETLSATYTEFLNLCNIIKSMSTDEIKEQRAYLASEYKKCNIKRILEDIDDAEGKVHGILRVYVNVGKESQLKSIYYKMFSRLDGLQSNGLDEALVRICSEFAKEFDGYKNLMVVADVKYAKVLNAYTDSLLNHSLFTSFQIIKVDKIEPLIDSTNEDINIDDFAFNLKFFAESIIDLSYEPFSYIAKTLDLWVHMIRARYEYLTILNNYGFLKIMSNHEKLVPRFAYQLRAKLPTN